MKFRITHAPTGDAFDIEAENVDAIRLRVYIEVRHRKWEVEDCFSTEVDA